MESNQLIYKEIHKLTDALPTDGRTISARFLKWFLINIVGLDEIGADDALCDHSNDKGIDGIIVDDDEESLIILQSKLKQNEPAHIGDKAIREFAGSIEQISTPDKVEEFLAGNAHPKVKTLLAQTDYAEKLKLGYQIKSYFVTNGQFDANGEEALSIFPGMKGYDRNTISSLHVDSTKTGGVLGKATLTFDTPPMLYQAGSDVTQLVIMAKGSDLLKFEGIEDNLNRPGFAGDF